jgi:hypothetical protein
MIDISYIKQPLTRAAVVAVAALLAVTPVALLGVLAAAS